MGCATSRPAPKPPAQSPPLSAPQFEQISKIKLVLLGDSGVGKSCLVQRYVRGAFDPASKITVGAAFQSHTVRLPDGKVLKLEIWDTAGQERYASLAPLYYRGAAAAIIVYDVTSKSSFAKAKHWISELHRNASDNLVVALVGNKTDLVDSREITQEDGQELADRDGMIFVETSARTAANCGQVFEEIAKAVSGYKEPVSTARSKAPQPERDAQTIPVSSSGDKPEEAEDSPDASPEDESTDTSSDKK